MSQPEGHNPLKNCELLCSSYYFKWPKVADAVIEAHLSVVLTTTPNCISILSKYQVLAVREPYALHWRIATL